MEMKKYLIIITIAVLTAACGTPKLVINNYNSAQSLATENNTEEAYSKIQEVVNYYESRSKAAPDSVYALAGNLALSTNNTNIAKEYLTKAQGLGYNSEDVILDLASVYNTINNVSLEIDQLTKFTELYPKSSHIFEVQKQLFHLYTTNDNNEKAVQIWDELNKEKFKDVQLMQDYVYLQNNLNNKTEAFNTSKKLLVLDPNNKIALYEIATHYFHLAENRYQREMKAYEKKKTRRQYQYLLEQLKLSEKDFKTSRMYFEQLFKLEQNSTYATYLMNINSRLNNEKKAEYYKKFIK